MAKAEDIKEYGIVAMVIRDDEYTPPYKLVINLGSDHGIEVGDNFLVFGEDEEIIDPVSGEPLGALEKVRGTGKVTHVQPKISTLECTDESIKPPTIRKTTGPGFLAALNPGILEEKEHYSPVKHPFENPEVGDKAKPI